MLLFEPEKETEREGELRLKIENIGWLAKSVTTVNKINAALIDLCCKNKQRYGKIKMGKSIKHMLRK